MDCPFRKFRNIEDKLGPSILNTIRQQIAIPSSNILHSLSTNRMEITSRKFPNMKRNLMIFKSLLL
jgi:hypothetical protein